MSQHREHLQGLQILGGTPSGKWESQGWIGTFLVREAIMVCPENLNKSEEYMYFDSLQRIIEQTLTLSNEQACGATYRTPYLLIACLNILEGARKKRITRQDVLNALYIDDDVANSEPNIFSGPLYLTLAEAQSLKTSRLYMFWHKQLETFEADRLEEGRPSLKFATKTPPHRAGLWNIIYADCDTPPVLQDAFKPKISNLLLDWERLDEMDDTPSPPAGSVALSRTPKGSNTKSSTLSKKRLRGSMNDGKELQPPVVKGHASTEPDDIPLAKRRKAVPAEKSTQRAESDVPVPTTTRVAPRQPARKPKVVPPLATIPEPQSTTSRRNPRRKNTDVPEKKKEATAKKRRVATKKGDVDVSDGSGSDVDVDKSGLPRGVSDKQGSPVGKRTRSAKAVRNAKGAPGGSKGKVVAPDPSDHDSPDEHAGGSGDAEAPPNDAETPPNDAETPPNDAQDPPNDKGKGVEHNDDENGVVVADPKAVAEAAAQEALRIAEELSRLIAESFNDPSFHRDWKLVIYDRWAKALPAFWFYLHPFAQEFLVEQFAPAACDGCVRSGSPCIIFLKAFVGCYSCKDRGVYCSLGAAINKQGFRNKALAWWITLLHHICAILELGTSEGCLSILPNYADLELEAEKMPEWAVNAYTKIRKVMSKVGVKKRWAELQQSVAPTWKFYAMPHSLLSSLRKKRPTRPYWPCPGEREQDVIERGITILTQGRNGTLPRIWASRAEVDGYKFSSKQAAQEARMKKKEAARKRKEERAKRKKQNTKKGDTSVPPEVDEAPTSDTEESSTDEDEAMDVDMPIPPSIADSDDEAPALPPPPPVDLAQEEENDISPNLFLTRDSSPEELQPQSSSGRELASMQNSISTLIKAVNQLRYPSFTQNQIDLLLPTIISQLQELNVTLKKFRVRTENTLEEHTNAIADMKSQLSACQASQDTHWPKVEKQLELLILHLPRTPSANAVVVGTQPSGTGQPKDIDTSTVATTSEHVNVSSDLVVRTTPATQISHAVPENSRGQSPTETTVRPINRDQAVTDSMQNIGLPTEIEPAVAEPVQDANLSAGLTILPSETTSKDAHGLNDPDQANQDAADTDR